MLSGKFFGVGLSVLVVVFAGCGQARVVPAPETQSREAGHRHHGWWCNEHGVPEEVCAQCNNQVAAQFKAKNDWCQEHDRPESQCFVCDPELEQRFAAQYEAKYGEKPPKPESDEPIDET